MAVFKECLGTTTREVQAKSFELSKNVYLMYFCGITEAK